jgi:hypothetical protein
MVLIVCRMCAVASLAGRQHTNLQDQRSSSSSSSIEKIASLTMKRSAIGMAE